MSGVSLFASAFCTAGTEPVSNILTPAAMPDLFALEASPVPLDSFASPDSPHPIILSRLHHLVGEAREERRAGRFIEAARRYRTAWEILAAPLEGAEQSPPVFRQFARGEVLLKEALFESVVLAGAENGPENLHRLAQFATHSPLELGDAVDRAKLDLLRAHTLLRHARQSEHPSSDLLEKAGQLAKGVRALGGEEVCFFSVLLRIEILANLLWLAHSRGGYKERNTFLGSLDEELTLLNQYGNRPGRAELIGRYYSDVAILFARLGLWGPALEKARTVTAGPLSITQAAKDLLACPMFKPFVDGSRFLTPGEIRLRAKGGKWRKQLQAAVALAHTRGLLDSLYLGIAGMAAGVVTDTLLQGGHAVFAGAAGAAAFLVAGSLVKGWRTDEARYAGEVGTFDRSIGESTRDISSLVVSGGLGAVAWSVPASLLDVGPEGIAVFSETLQHALEMYLRFGRWITSGTALSGLSGSFSSVDFPALLYHIYTKSAGLLFAANLLIPGWRRHTDRWAWCFMPGALMLSADIGMVISGQSPVDFIPHFGDARYWDRVERVLIVTGEILLMMMTAGVVALEKKTPGAVLSILRPRTTNYMLPLAAAITNGMTSAIGGTMQKGETPEHLGLMAIQGAAITMGLLPITLGLSGVLKGKIPIGAGIHEGWSDARGENLLRRLSGAAGGALAAFRVPYAHNRIFRSATLDLPAAGLRAMLGWDTNAGQVAMSSTNLVAGNGTATATWPETGGTRWERDALAKTARAGSMLQMDDFITKVGSTMHPAHLFLDHASQRDRFWPLHAVTRAVAPPRFPHRPNSYFYAGLDQMLHGGTAERLSAEELAVLLEYVRTHAGEAESFDKLRPLVMVLAAARDSTVFGDQIRQFFEENPGLFDLFALDPEKEIPKGRSRLHRRRLVCRAVAESFSHFEARVKAHRRAGANQGLMEGLFQT